jgi:hypothetical protein
MPVSTMPMITPLPPALKFQPKTFAAMLCAVAHQPPAKLPVELQGSGVVVLSGRNEPGRTSSEPLPVVEIAGDVTLLPAPRPSGPDTSIERVKPARTASELTSEADIDPKPSASDCVCVRVTISAESLSTSCRAVSTARAPTAPSEKATANEATSHDCMRITPPDYPNEARIACVPTVKIVSDAPDGSTKSSLKPVAAASQFG